jgi:hypothetical protein
MVLDLDLNLERRGHGGWKVSQGGMRDEADETAGAGL